MAQKISIYLDNAASTPMRPEIIDVMTQYFNENYANPSSVYGVAVAAKVAMEAAAADIGATINAAANEIYFTGGGTESINWAIKSAALTVKNKGRHIITSTVEHHAVLHTCEYLEKNGYDVTFLPVDKFGIISTEDFAAAVRPDTILATIMLANNEVGTLQPVAEIGAILKTINQTRKNKILFHTDAVQAMGHIDIDVDALGVDMLSMSAHKLNGPKGVGALYIRRGVALPAFLHGGGHERGRRAGTENVAGIVAFGLAARLAKEEMAAEAKRLSALRDGFIKKILKEVSHSYLNGHPTQRLPGNINLAFDCIEGEGMLLLLDAKGIAASSGSACTSGSLDPSHVLLAMGIPHEKAHGSLRITLGRYTTQADLDALSEVLPPIVQRLRSMSPLWDDLIK